jgi:GNAT superfamily N-acetyltransferase
MSDTPAPEDSHLLDVTDTAGEVVQPQWLARAEGLLRHLRPQLPADYPTAMARVFASGGRMTVAAEGEAVVGVAVWRILENTVFGRFLYVDDLVTDQTRRSRGTGRALLSRCETLAWKAGCARVVLDSGVQRDRAHRFYFREGYAIQAFNFGKTRPSASAV